jgi:hypothetical protein
MARERSPEAIMSLLNNLFTRFDALCTHHCLFKVRLTAAAAGCRPAVWLS